MASRQPAVAPARRTGCRDRHASLDRSSPSAAIIGVATCEDDISSDRSEHEIRKRERLRIPGDIRERCMPAHRQPPKRSSRAPMHGDARAHAHCGSSRRARDSRSRTTPRRRASRTPPFWRRHVRCCPGIRRASKRDVASPPTARMPRKREEHRQRVLVRTLNCL
jgi:hypothetical protein